MRIKERGFHYQKNATFESTAKAVLANGMCRVRLRFLVFWYYKGRINEKGQQNGAYYKRPDQQRYSNFVRTLRIPLPCQY